jgi:hypothetical protein
MGTTVKWHGRKMLSAFMDITDLLKGHPDGPLGYKASIVRGVMDSAAVKLSEQSKKTKQKYQKEVPGPDGQLVKLPFEQDGQPLQAGMWCTNIRAYEAEEAATLAVETELVFPVRFTFEELAAYREPVKDVSGAIAAWQGIRGTFWVHLAELIDPPIQQPVVPQPEVK